MKIVVIIFAIWCVLPSVVRAREPAENPEDPAKYTREHRLVFFAVLEGLYEEGVAGEALALMIPDADGMWIEGKPGQTNFVYSCPLCTPAFDALRLYEDRREFYGQKMTKDTTFGPGLDAAMLARLKSSPQERRDAIQELIQRWVSRRLDAMALTDEERNAIEYQLREMKKEGEKALKRFQEKPPGDVFAEHYRDWKKCPVCSGAAPGLAD